MALAKSRRMKVLIRLNPKKDIGVAPKVARLKKLMGEHTKDIINEANRQGLAFIQRAALESLQGSMSEARTPFRTGTLEAAIMSDKYSKADGLGIRFFIDELIREDVPYFAALEYGDDYWVGKKLPFIFLATKRGGAPGNSPDAKKSQYSNNHRPDPVRGSGIKEKEKLRARGGTGTKMTDRVVGPREIDRLNGGDPNVKGRRRTQGKNKGKITGRGVYLVTIKRPVPDYHYILAARTKFIDGKIYAKDLDRLIKNSALTSEGVKWVRSGR